MALYSDNDRKTAIRNFIFARSKKLAKIQSYYVIKDCLNDDKVEILCKLNKSGVNRSQYYPYKVISQYYTDKDARSYFDWLISVADGTRIKSKEVFKKAINQLYMFIFGLDNFEASSTITLLKPFSIDETLVDFENKLSNFDKKINRMNNQILDALQKIIDWQQKYQPYLDRTKKDQDSFFKNPITPKGDSE